MFAKPTYLTANDLEITDEEHRGLIQVMRNLRRSHWFSRKPLVYFNMQSCRACCGGLLAREMNRHTLLYVAQGGASPSLLPLFYPGGHKVENNSVSRVYYGHKAWSATNRQGAMAILNFLMHGDPRWDEVMA